jgi:hypothetical protein
MTHARVLLWKFFLSAGEHLFSPLGMDAQCVIGIPLQLSLAEPSDILTAGACSCSFPCPIGCADNCAPLPQRQPKTNNNEPPAEARRTPGSLGGDKGEGFLYRRGLIATTFSADAKLLRCGNRITSSDSPSASAISIICLISRGCGMKPSFCQCLRAARQCPTVASSGKTKTSGPTSRARRFSGILKRTVVGIGIRCFIGAP